MAKLNGYFNDEANKQAQATLALMGTFEIEESYKLDSDDYSAKIDVARWENCREQGYVLSMRDEQNKQINIAFFEHRNSDALCAIKWEQNTINSPNIDSAKFDGQCYKDKWDVSHEVPYCAVYDMAKWIESELTKFWVDGMAGKDNA